MSGRDGPQGAEVALSVKGTLPALLLLGSRLVRGLISCHILNKENLCFH